jgi:hypothetical protein
MKKKIKYTQMKRKKTPQITSKTNHENKFQNRFE